jgi:hypothetical protein
MLALPAAAQVPSETILPTTTQAWVSMPVVDDAVKTWGQTQLGKLWNDAVMEPLRKDLEAQARARDKEPITVLGIDWDDLKSIAGGELSMALIHPRGGKPTRNILVDVTGRLEAAKAVQKKLYAAQDKQKVAWFIRKVGSTTINYSTKDKKTTLAEFLHGNLFCIARDENVAEDILKRHVNRGKDNLDTFAPFVKVNERLAADTKLLAGAPQAKTLASPHIRWFVQPIGLGEARQQLDPDRDPEALDVLKISKKSGFDGVQGIGGVARLREGDYDILNRAAIYAPKPWKLSLPMLSMVNDDNLTAKGEWWLPKKVDTFSIANLELLTAFDHFGPYFDEAVAGGRRDAFQKTMNGLKNRSIGPRVDIREEIIKSLVRKGPLGRNVARCIRISRHRPSTVVSPDNERQLIAVRIEPPEAEPKVADAVGRYYKPDPTAKFREKWVGGYSIWDFEPEEQDAEEEEEGGKKKPPALRVAGGGKDVSVAAPPAREHEAICVAEGYLFYAKHISLMKELLDHMVSKKAEQQAKTTVLSLEDDLDYQAVMSELDHQQKLRSWTQACCRQFDRRDESGFANYELMRSGGLKNSQSNMAKLLLDLLDPSGEGKPFDMSKLPPHGQVRRYFKPAGTLFHNETNGEFAAMPDWCGWFVLNFTLHE